MISDFVDLVNNIVCFSELDKLTKYYNYSFKESEIQLLDRLCCFLQKCEEIDSNINFIKEMRENDK